MFFDFSWLVNFNFGSNLKTLLVVPVSEEKRLKLYQRKFDANKKVLYHRQQKK